MKLLKSLFVFILLSFLTMQNANAGSYFGGEISWLETSRDTFRISLTIYRDCDGTTYGSTPNLSVLDCKKNVINSSGVITKILTKDVTPVCKRSCTKCSSTSCSFKYGIQKIVYQQKVIIPSTSKSCCDFIISWTGDDWRSSYITTGAAGQGIYVQAKLNRCSYGLDNSPVFYLNPLMMVYAKQCTSFSLGAYDIDVDSMGRRDSLVYSLYSPLNTSTTKTSWSAPYSYDKPFKFFSFPNKTWNPATCSGFKLDSFTGVLSFNSTKKENTVIGIKVEEYGRDKSGKVYKKGEINRDCGLIITDSSTNRVPLLSGINGGKTTDTTICANQSVCFAISSNDYDVNDTVSVSWNQSLQFLGATFVTEKKKQHPKSIFCWKPTNAQATSVPYEFVVSATDDACPVDGRVNKLFRVFVRPSVSGAITVKDLGCGDYNYTLNATGGSTILKKSIQWSSSDSFSANDTFSITHHYRKSGDSSNVYLKFSGGSGSCITHLTSSVYIGPYIYVQLPNDTQVCRSTSLKILPVVSKGKTPYKYKWNTGDTTLSISPVISKDTFFVFTAGDALCSNFDTIKIRLKASPIANAGNDTSFCGKGSSITIGSTSISGNTYSWVSRPVGLTSSLSNPTVLPSLTTTYYQTVQNSLSGCSISDSVIITIDPACVFPGDANYDKIVDAKDILNIGLGYGKTGRARPNATTGWYAQPCMDWKDTFAHAINYKHADCNGDSTINNNDTLAITVNYSKTHLKTLQRSQGNPGDLPLQIVFNKDSLQAGDTLIASFILGDKTSPAKNFYGLAFGINFDNSLVDTSTFNIDFNSSWMGNKNTFLHFNKNLFNNNRIDIAATRINHSDTTGAGPICRIKMLVSKTLPAGTSKLRFTLSDNKQINHLGMDIPVYMSDDSIILKQTFTGVNPAEHLLNNLNIYPNPFSGFTNIEYSLIKPGKVKIEVFDLMGRKIATLADAKQDAGKHTLKFENEAAAGQYILRIQEGGEVIYRRIVGVGR